MSAILPIQIETSLTEIKIHVRFVHMNCTINTKEFPFYVDRKSKMISSHPGQSSEYRSLWENIKMVSFGQIWKKMTTPIWVLYETYWKKKYIDSGILEIQILYHMFLRWTCIHLTLIYPWWPSTMLYDVGNTLRNTEHSRQNAFELRISHEWTFSLY